MNQRYCNGMVHVIKQGENLYQLSRMYRVPLALILRANPYVDVYNLQIGQEICIPVARPFPGMMNPGRPQGTPPQTMPPEDIPPRPPMIQPRETESREECESCEERVEYRETEISEEPPVFVCDGTKSLGEVLKLGEITLEKLLEMNDLEHIIIAADVPLRLPKKV